MSEDVDRIVKVIPKVESEVVEIVKGLKVEDAVLPCVKAYILNSIVLRMAYSIRKGGSVDVDKYILDVKKALYEKGRVKDLIDTCRLYVELKDRKPHTVADIGCGVGLNLNIIKSYVNYPLFLVGIDKNLYFLKVLNHMLEDIDVIQADALMLPLRVESIDMIFNTAVIHELPSLKAIDEFKRVLKSGGSILLRDFTIRYVPSLIMDIIRRFKMMLKMKSETLYTLEQLRSKIRSIGMSIERIASFKRTRFTSSTTIIATKK